MTQHGQYQGMSIALMWSFLSEKYGSEFHDHNRRLRQTYRAAADEPEVPPNIQVGEE